MHAQELVERVSICTIHINLGEHWEFRTVFLSCELFDFSFSSWLLCIELIAWESKDFETFFAELLVDLNHFFVVLIGQTSLCRDVHDHDALLSVDQCL